MAGHAYSFLGTAKFGLDQLVKLRNPWGKGQSVLLLTACLMRAHRRVEWRMVRQ